MILWAVQSDISTRIIVPFCVAIPHLQLSRMRIYGCICRFNDITSGLFLPSSAIDPISLLHMLTVTQRLFLTFHRTLAIEGTDLV